MGKKSAAPPKPTVLSVQAMFQAREDGTIEPDFLGRLHTIKLPREVLGRISTEPKLPVMKVQWSWNSPLQVVSVIHTVHIEYVEHGRNDKTKVMQVTTNSLLAVYDFGAEVQGGILVGRCTVNWRNPSTGETGTTGAGEGKWSILGDQPMKEAVKKLLGTIPLQVIGFKESKFRQFDNVGLPLFGPPNGFGIMQLDNPKPTARQLWDWKQNVGGGFALFKKKNAEVNQHFKNLYKKYPDAPQLTAKQLQLAIYQYYNGGFYWKWDDKAKKWVTYGVTAYGDDAVRIEKLVKAGKPPAGWN